MSFLCRNKYLFFYLMRVLSRRVSSFSKLLARQDSKICITSKSCSLHNIVKAYHTKHAIKYMTMTMTMK